MKPALFILSVLISTITQAQTTPPQKLNYQAVARNAAGTTIANQNIGVKIEVLDADQTTVVYAETHTVTTNQFGLFTLQIGGGTTTLGSFAGINWGSGNKYQKTSVDLTGGKNYQLMGITQFMSVPYALYAGSVANNGGKNTVILTDTVSNAGAQKIIAEEVGPNTQVLRIINCTKLTNVTLSAITSLTELIISQNTLLSTVNLPNLKICMGYCSISKNPKLNNLNVSSLEKIISGRAGGNYEVFEIMVNGFTSLTFPSLKSISSNIYIFENANFSSISFPSLTDIGTKINNNLSIAIISPKLSSISFPALKNCFGNMNINSEIKSQSITLPALEFITGLGFNNFLSSFSAPNAVSIGSLGFGKGITFLNLPALNKLIRLELDSSNLTSLSLPSLKSLESISLKRNSLLTSVNMPILESIYSISGISYFRIENNAQLSSLNLPSLRKINVKVSVINNSILSTVDLPILTSIENDFGIVNNPLLTTLKISNFTSFKGSKFTLNNNKLSSSKINALLRQLVAMSPVLSQKTILLKQLPAAPPSGQGAVDKATLISNGNKVTTD